MFDDNSETARRSKGWCRGVLCFLLIYVAYVQGQTPDQSASISGIVVDGGAKPVHGALVVLVRVSGPKLPKRFLPPSVRSDLNGGFKVANLPSGTYRGCASLAGTTLLNPCEWFDNPPTLVVGIGQAKEGLRVTMQQGKQLNIRLDDAQQLLKAPVKGKPSETVKPVIVQISSPRGLHLPHTVAGDGGGQTHTFAVPAGMPLKIDVWSAACSVKGQGTGASVNINEGLPGSSGKPVIQSFQLESAEQSRQYGFTVQARGK